MQFSRKWCVPIHNWFLGWRSQRARTKTREQRFAQKVSFVYGNQPKEMTFTREEVEEQLRNMD